MIDHVFGLIYTVLLLGGMSYFFHQKSKEWDDREYFSFFRGDWGNISILSAAVSLVTRTIIVHYAPATSEILLIPVSIAVFALVFSAWTDAWSGHAPLEVAWLGIGLSLPFMVYGLFTSHQGWLGLASVAIWGCICFFLYFNRGLGDADVRLLWLINISTIWFVGLYWSTIIFGTAALLQLVVHILASVFKIGTLRDMEYTRRELKRRKFWSKIFKNIDTEKESRVRRAVQFIPVLAFTYIVAFVVLMAFNPELLLVNIPSVVGIRTLL